MRNKQVPATPRRGASRLAEEPVFKKQRKAPSVVWLKHIPWSLFMLVIFVSGFLYSTVWLTGLTVKYLDQPIRNVVVLGDTENLNVADLRHQVLALGKQGFVTTDMDQLRTVAEAFGWVQTVKVKRFWPYGVELTVEEHMPVARWGKQHLLSSEGEVFEVVDTHDFKNLPELYGSEGQELELMATYRDLSHLLASIGLGIESLVQSSRGAWQLVCRNKLVLNLGRDQVNQKVSKFVSVFKQVLHEKVEQIEQVDLRYTNGLAVAWKAQEQKI